MVPSVASERACQVLTGPSFSARVTTFRGSAREQRVDLVPGVATIHGKYAIVVTGRCHRGPAGARRTRTMMSGFLPSTINSG